MYKNFKIIFALIVLFILFCFLSAYSYASNISNNISDSVFRLHVIANSNSENDQNLKYLVRNDILSFVNTLNLTSSKEKNIQILSKNLDTIKNIAQKTIKNNNYNYSVSVEIGNFSFPTKNYGDITLPAGYYDSIQVKLGTASGENWWCVMFPPLCFIDVSSGIIENDSKNLLEESLSKEEYALINQEDNTISFKFKLLEFFQEIKLKTAKN